MRDKNFRIGFFHKFWLVLVLLACGAVHAQSNIVDMTNNTPWVVRFGYSSCNLSIDGQYAEIPANTYRKVTVPLCGANPGSFVNSKVPITFQIRSLPAGKSYQAVTFNDGVPVQTVTVGQAYATSIGNLEYKTIEFNYDKCSASIVSWGAGGACSASTTLSSAGQAVALSSVGNGIKGSATATCKSDFKWQLSSAVCQADLPISGLVATQGTLVGQIKLTWPHVSGANRYNLQYRKLGETGWTYVSDVNSGWQLSTEDEGKYEFQVAGANSAGTGNWSSVAVGYIQQSCGAANISWGTSNYCAGTSVSGKPGTNQIVSNTAGGASGQATATCNGSTGNWTITNANCTSNLEKSSSINASDGIFNGKILVEWGDIPHADSYQVQYRKVGDANWMERSNNSTSWEFLTVDRSRYEFRVAAKNILGQGDWSEIDTGYISQNCRASTVKWGASDFCMAAVEEGNPNTVRDLLNTAAGASGNVKAICDAETGNWIISDATCSSNIPAPVSFKATQGTMVEAVGTQWGNSAGVSAYDIRYRKSSDEGWILAPDVTTGWIALINDPGDYNFQLRGKNVLGTGDWSATTTGWIQRCEASAVKWGPGALCLATPTIVKSGDSLLVDNEISGVTGAAKASCVSGAWVLSESACTLNLNLVATDGTLEDEVGLSWTNSAQGISGIKYDLFRGDEKISSGLSALSGSDKQAERGIEYVYKVQATYRGEVVGETTDPGHIPLCRAARLVGASLAADMSSIDGLIERWECLGDLQGTSFYNSQEPQGLHLAGERVYRSFRVAVPSDLVDGSHVLHLGLQSTGVTLNAKRTYDIPFKLDRASIAVKNLSITYNGSPAVDGIESNSVGRFGVRMEGGAGIGFAEEVR